MNNPVNLIDPTGMAPDGWIEQRNGDRTTLTHVDGVETVQQAVVAGFENVTGVHNYDSFTIVEPNSYCFNNDGTVDGVELRQSTQVEGMFYGYTDGGTEVHTFTYQQGINFRQSGAITPLGGAFDILGLKEMFFGELAEATGSPLAGLALSIVAGKGKASASNAIKSGNNNLPKGFKLSKEFGKSHGQDVYKKGNYYYSKDIDSHNGGAWKVFEANGKRLKRVGTADENLKIFKK
jgi:hypothetical protein